MILLCHVMLSACLVCLCDFFSCYTNMWWIFSIGVILTCDKLMMMLNSTNQHDWVLFHILSSKISVGNKRAYDYEQWWPWFSLLFCVMRLHVVSYSRFVYLFCNAFLASNIDGLVWLTCDLFGDGNLRYYSKVYSYFVVTQ